MARTNGKSDVGPEELDVEHELPAAENEAEVAESNLAAEQPVGELAKVKAERDALLERMARMQAEFENSRKRATREQQEYKEFALVEALKSLLPILDSFDRALQARTQNPTDFRSGIELISKQLHDALNKLGLRTVPAKGEPFDPRLHEAIEIVDTPGAKDNHIVDELQRGYKLKDRLLRPAMVRVARNPKH
jgi:molecular chaperone GrpE